MKNHLIRLLVLPTLLAGIACLSACNRAERAEAKDAVQDTAANVKASVQDAAGDIKAFASSSWAKVRDYSYDRRADFTTEARAVSSRLDADLSKMRAEYSEATASATRKAAMTELRDSETNYRQKLDALGSATSATWDAAKNNVILAWDRLQAAYYKARAE